MALTIQQNPTTPNQANGDLLYVVTSNKTNSPQFQYVMEVSDGTNTVVTKQQPNPYGKGVFNIGQIARDFVGVDNIWKTQEVSLSTLSGQTISSVFYEETGSSISSSVGYSSGVSGSGVYTLNGVNDYDDWNFPSASYYTSSLSDDDVFYRESSLTNAPLTQSIRDDEYATLSVINGNFDNDANYKQDIFYFEVKVYDDNDSLLQTFDWYNLTGNGGGPRSGSTQEWSSPGVYNGQTDGTKLIHFAAGPQNFSDSGITLNSAWSYYTIESQAQASDRAPYPSMVWLNRRYKKQDGQCAYSGVRFAFLNELGTFDYFTFPYADSKTDGITRETYDSNFVNYSTSTNGVPYDTSRRGTDIYSIKYDERRTAESDFLSQAEADWVRELVESPSVFIQDGTAFRPIVVTNAAFNYKTNPLTQKLFRITLEYKVANQRFGR